MTIERWRRLRRTATTQHDPWSRLLAAARRVGRHGERRCDHLHDTVSRYDHAAKRLELLLTCPVCETEKVMHSLVYEPGSTIRETTKERLLMETRSADPKHGDLARGGETLDG